VVRQNLYETRYVVLTPEHVSFEFAIAGAASRIFALLIDSCVIGVLLMAGLTIIANIGFVSRTMAGFLQFVAVFLIQWGYFVTMEVTTGGQSVGKKVLGLRVMRSDGMRILFFHSTIRNLFRVVDSLPVFYLVGGLACLHSQLLRRLGDHAAGTVVVRDPRHPLPEAIVPPSQRYNSLVENPSVIRAVRQRLTPKEREVLLSLALRREEIDLAARLELFAEAAALLSQRLGIEKPPFFSDEKFVLNLTAVAALPQDPMRLSVP